MLPNPTLYNLNEQKKLRLRQKPIENEAPISVLIPKWFLLHGMPQNIESLEDVEKIIFHMDSTHLQKPWIPEIYNYFLPNNSSVKEKLNIAIEIWQRIIIDFAKPSCKLNIPIETFYKAAMNTNYAHQALNILNMTMDTSTSTSVFEIGAGAGFMAPMLLNTNKSISTYIHHDIYQPFYMLQSLCNNYAIQATNEYQHLDTSITEFEISLPPKNNKGFSLHPDSQLNIHKLGINTTNKFGQKLILSMPWWKIQYYKKLQSQVSLWIANDCLQEMEKDQCEFWLNLIDQSLTKDCLLLVSGSGAPHTFILWDVIKNTNLRPLFMGRLSVPFSDGVRDIFELNLFANSESKYFLNRESNTIPFEAVSLFRIISRGVHAEVKVRDKYPKMAYIDPAAAPFISILFQELNLQIPKSTGIFFDGIELNDLDIFIN